MNRSTLARSYLLIAMLFLLLLSATWIVTLRMAEDEIKSLPGISTIMNRTSQVIAEQIGSLENRRDEHLQPIGNRIRHDWFPAGIDPSSADDSASVEMRDMARQVAFYYRSGNFEKAYQISSGFLSRFDPRTTFPAGTEALNPFVTVFLIRTRCLKDHLGVDPDNPEFMESGSMLATLVNVEAGRVSAPLLDAILERNHDLFDADDLLHIRLRIEFRKFCHACNPEIVNIDEPDAGIPFFGSIAFVRASETGNGLFIFTAPEASDKSRGKDGEIQKMARFSSFPGEVITRLEALQKMLEVEKDGYTLHYDIVDLSSTVPQLTGDHDSGQFSIRHGIRYSIALNSHFAGDKHRSIRTRYRLGAAGISLVVLFVCFFIARYLRGMDRLQRLREDFLHILSHELKTPVAAIRLYADTIASAVDDENVTGYTRVITGRTGEIERIINNMLYFNKLAEAGTEEALGRALLQDKGGDLAETFKSVAAELTGGYGKTMTVDALPGSIPVALDPAALRIVVANLVDNALKHNPADTLSVSVSAVREGSLWLVDLRDGGSLPGNVEPDSLFAKFERRTPGDARSGLGLGLYLVRRLLRIAGGDIRISTSAPLVFRLIIPAGSTTT